MIVMISYNFIMLKIHISEKNVENFGFFLQ